MDDLARWLNTQLDEDAAEAQRTADEYGAQWTAQPRTDSVSSDRGADVIDEPGAPIGFIAAHDPARVLREIDAKREIIREHHRSGVNCPQCSLGTEDGEVVYQRDPCQTLRLLALPYSDRSGYDSERWAPWPIRPYPVPPWTLTDMLGIGQEPPEDDQES